MQSSRQIRAREPPSPSVQRLDHEHHHSRLWGSMSSGEVRLINGKRVATPEYRSWQMMKNRCLNPRAEDYAYYGGRGITIDHKWFDFDIFLLDMGRRPTLAHTLERLNGEDDYHANNCVWATREAQSRNRAYAKMSLKKARKVREKYSTGNFHQYQLAHEFGVSQRTISLITRNEIWKEKGAGT